MTLDELTHPASGPATTDWPSWRAERPAAAPLAPEPPAPASGRVGLVRRARAFVGRAGTGLVAAAVSSLCCIPAALAFALGLGGSAALVGLTQYRPLFFATGVLGALAATWWGLRRSQRCCSPAEDRRNRLLIPALTLGTFAASYLFINYALLPWLYTLG